MAVESKEHPPDDVAFLARPGPGRKTIRLTAKQLIFAQGDSADSVIYLEEGYAKISVVSPTGKEATISILSAGDFAGEDSLAAPNRLRLAALVTLTPCMVIRISREETIRLMHFEPKFNDLFLKFLLKRSMRVQADLVDQLFNSSEKRLARILLLMARFGESGESQPSIPRISQETLAEW